jgi:radical SAM protein with 4Fe4S-binding SPASM domain
MLYRQKFNTFIRVYDSGIPTERVGYIMTKYRFNDLVTDASGSVFLAALSRAPQTIDELAAKIAASFTGVGMDMIKQDAIQFYQMIEKGGFIISGETPEELDKKDTRFSYKNATPETIEKNMDTETGGSGTKSQDYLEEYFKNHPYLVSMQMEITSRCNERCVHCYIPHHNKLHNMDESLFYDVLEQCQEMGVLDLTLSGGEPMCHPHFADFIRKLKDYDFTVAILSNLTMLNDEILAVMKEQHSFDVQTSLYSMNPAIHDSITQLPGSFFKTHDAILRLIDNDIPLHINCPTMKQNRDCYGDVLEWAHGHKIKTSTDYIMMARYDHTAGNLDNRLSIKEVGKVISGIIDRDKNYQREVSRPDFKAAYQRDRSNDRICGVCIAKICMVENGNVHPCPGWYNYVCGNVRETSLKDIWENSPKVKYLRSLRKKDIPKCLDCPDRGFCAVCMARNANENQEMSAVGTLGNPLKINEHFCKVAALNRKIVLEWKEKIKQQEAAT